LVKWGSSAGAPTAALFAGIGALELGLSRAGFHARLMADVDEAAQAVLRARFPGIEIVADVADIPHLAQNTALVTAGFPCQDLSMAGTKQGLARL
jgi:DNA (cytosine-5)-methyltransferase 1